MIGPTRVDVRMYNVGFGDCFLITFGYPTAVDGRAERHMLIDFGTKAKPVRGATMPDIARQIAADSGGKLDVLVLSHRHQDHISGFSPANGGSTIRSLAPDRVLRPWTERPGVDAPGPAGGQDQLVARSLSAGQAFAQRVAELRYPPRPTAIQREMQHVASLQVHNLAAIGLLDELSDGGRGRYLRFGGDPADADPGTADILPGVTITVLGPPDPAKQPSVYSYAAESPEYWLRMSRQVPAAVQASIDARTEPEPAGGRPLAPGPARWIVDRLERLHQRSALELVQTFDAVLNNTSLILVIEAAGHVMLFPGDAQIENWDYCLNGRDVDTAGTRALLGRVDLYKVGHHGSRNATPKASLYPLLHGTSAGGSLAMMSTLPGFYHETHPVPADALVRQLGSPPFALLSSAADLKGSDRPPVVHAVGAVGAPFGRVTP